MKLHDGCPVVEDLLKANPDAHQEAWGSGLFMQVAQGLSGQMMDAVRGTRAGLTAERIEAIRQTGIEEWGNLDEPDGEAAYLNDNPAIAKAIHDCELRIQLGQCATNPK